MSKYIINKNKQNSDNGENYEVHNEETCNHLPLSQNRIDLGNFDDCHKAKAYAKRKFPEQSDDIDGCYYCSESCHNE